MINYLVMFSVLPKKVLFYWQARKSRARCHLTALVDGVMTPFHLRICKKWHPVDYFFNEVVNIATKGEITLFLMFQLI